MSNLEPIGFVRSALRFRHEAPRQGTLLPPDLRAAGTLQLLSGQNHELAVQGLDAFERVWLIFGFHLNRRAKAIVRPPGSEGQVGTFATRSPYRQNGLGLSCVRLLEVNGLQLQLAELDLLDGTPVFDIKPYVPSYDSYPQSRHAPYAGGEPGSFFEIEESPAFLSAAEFIAERGGPHLRRVVAVQLAQQPTDARRKRVRAIQSNQYELSFRMWRIAFVTSGSDRRLQVTGISSGYAQAELAALDDPYEDKQLHRLFAEHFGNGNL